VSTVLSRLGPVTAEFPLILSWSRKALPLRAVRVPTPAKTKSLGLGAPLWHESGSVEEPFDFCGHISRLCRDVAARCAELKHIDVSRLLFAMTQARSGRRHGLQARVTPLRFRAGRLQRLRRGVPYQVQRYLVDDRDMLYLVTFCLPRFLDQDFDDKLITLFHELFHISPDFDGDLRRHEGRCKLHSRSKKAYDEQMAALAREYLATKPDPKLHGFLRLNFAQLQHRHGSVAGVIVPRPKLIPITTAARER
jgi:Putative phage metallopeptidase